MLMSDVLLLPMKPMPRFAKLDTVQFVSESPWWDGNAWGCNRKIGGSLIA